MENKAPEYRAALAAREENEALQAQLAEARAENERAREHKFGLYATIETLEAEVERAKAENEQLREAGVTDYSKLGTGSNRVVCHFCPGLWKSGEKAKHRRGCPLEGKNVKKGGDTDG